MRYLMLFLASLFSVLLGGAVLPRLLIFGVQLDIIFAVMAALVLEERTLTPVFYLAGGSVVLDILFARSIGFFSAPYFIAGLLLYLFALLKAPVRWYWTSAVGAVVYAVKEILNGLFSALLGNPVTLMAGILRYVLPGMLLNGLLTMLLYLAAHRLYANGALRPTYVRRDEDIGL